MNLCLLITLNIQLHLFLFCDGCCVNQVNQLVFAYHQTCLSVLFSFSLYKCVKHAICVFFFADTEVMFFFYYN